jgi:hypothetical protein
MTRKSFSVFRTAIIFLLVFMVTTAPLQAAGDEQKIEQQKADLRKMANETLT